MNHEKYKLGQEVALYGRIESIDIEDVRDIEHTTTLKINTGPRIIHVNPKCENVITDPKPRKPLVPQCVADWLVNMHQYGYEIEKEPRYLVKVKGIGGRSCYLNKNLYNQEWFFGNYSYLEKFRTHHTRKELEEGSFDWVFDCEGVEIEEVE